MTKFQNLFKTLRSRSQVTEGYLSEDARIVLSARKTS